MFDVLLLMFCVVFIIVATTRFSLHPFLALFLAALLFGLISGMPFETIIESINGGFGSTLSNIGFIIIFGTIIGSFLENSGGAYTLAGRVIKTVGEKRIPLAMGIIGYLVSIPVIRGFGTAYPLSPEQGVIAEKRCKTCGFDHRSRPGTHGDPLPDTADTGADCGCGNLWRRPRTGDPSGAPGEFCRADSGDTVRNLVCTAV